MEPGTNARSLVIAPQWIGDAVMTEPLMLRLHQRGERLSVGALPWVAPVYRAMPQVAEVIEFPFQHGGLQWQARRAMARQLRGRFDTAYVLPNSAKSALLPFLAGIRRRIGYHGEMRYGLLTQRLPNPPRDERPPMVGFYSALAGERGTEADRPRLLLPPAQIDAVLQAHGLARRGFHVFAPGAEFGSSKRWPPQHYAELAAGLALPVLLLGSGKEHALCEQIAQAAPGRCTNLAGKTALLDAFGLIAAAHSVVSNDSGLMHVAAAFGTPQVAVYGSTSPEHTPPLSDAAAVLWLKRDAAYQPPLDCAPCFQRECPLGHNRCMVDIRPARVAEVLATIA